MLFPRSYAWTRLQKRAIVGGTVVCLAALTFFIYSYERYYRGPGEEILYGRWACAECIPVGPIFYSFNPNHTFSLGGEYEEEFGPFALGRWYAGGSQIFLRFSGDDLADIPPVVMRIIDIKPDELRLRNNGSKVIYLFRRTVRPAANASNQSLERTAGRCVESH